MPRITRRQPPPVPAPPPVQPVTTVITEPPQPIRTVFLTAEPTAVRAAKSNGVPEIGGSQGGFIGLVVGLAVIMLVSCVGVFYLLKTRKGGGNPRKRLGGQNRDIETSSGPSAVGGTVEMSFPSQGRFAGTFGGRGRSGWGRADSAEYDPVETADIVDEAGARYRDYKRTLDAAGGDAAAARHLRQDSASSSASTVRLEPPASPTGSDKADGPKAIGGGAEHPRYSQHVEPNGRRRATDDTLVSPTSIAHPLGVGGSKFHEMIT